MKTRPNGQCRRGHNSREALRDLALPLMCKNMNQCQPNAFLLRTDQQGAVRLLGSLVSHDLDDDLTVARAIIEVHEDHLLPGPKRHTPPKEWNAE